MSARRAGYIMAIWSLALTVAGCDSATDLNHQVVPTSTTKFAGELSLATTPPPRAAVASPPADTPAGSPDVNRKIVYSADIALTVESLNGVAEQVLDLVRRSGGYVAESNLAGSVGAARSATWKIRIPVGGFDGFVTAMQELGEISHVRTSSQDVSEEYYDIDARIRNKTREEERLLTLLAERPGKLEDIIAVERELARVREELERMQGRLRLLTDLTSLTTVQITIAEVQGYAPPLAATFAVRLRRAWEGSLTSLRSSIESALVAVTALLPWLGAAGGLAAVAIAAARGVRRFKSQRAA